MPIMFDKSKEILSIALLDGETNIKKILNQVLKMDQYDLDDFNLRTTLHKKLSQYSKGSLQTKLGNQLQLLGIDVIPGTQVEYVKVSDGYRIVQYVKSINEIDMKYYTKIIEKLIINLGFEQELKTKNIQTLDAWF
jgi:DNA polymerase elongation subunit (family B)